MYGYLLWSQPSTATTKLPQFRIQSKSKYNCHTEPKLRDFEFLKFVDTVKNQAFKSITNIQMEHSPGTFQTCISLVNMIYIFMRLEGDTD